MVDSKGIQPDLTRIQDLKKWPQPSLANKLKRLLGGINFYGNFILHFS
jgi:hypothetical protein